MKKHLFIYCAGGSGKEIHAIAERYNAKHFVWTSIRFVDDVVGKRDGEVIRFADFLALRIAAEESEFLIANGEPAHRITLMDKIRSNGYSLATLIDDATSVAPNAVIGAGTILYPGVHVSPNTVIGENCLIYYNSCIAHDCRVDEHCVISMLASISGHCIIGAACFLGAHVAIRDRVQVGEKCILGMGCMLLKDAQARGVYAGVPARRLRENIKERVFG